MKAKPTKWGLNSFVFADVNGYIIDFAVYYSRLWLWQLDSTVKVWRRNKECYTVCCTDRLTAFGRSSGMVWDVISLTRGNLSAERYRDKILQPVAMQYPILELNFILQHNNVWPHRVGFVRDYLHNLEMERREWPACSSDLNLMEEFWDQLGCAVCSRMTNTTRLADLWQTLVEEWDPILQQCVSKLVTNMRKRYQTGTEYGSSICSLGFWLINE